MNPCFSQTEMNTMQWTVTSTPQHNKFLEQTGPSYEWKDLPNKAVIPSLITQKLFVANTQNSWTHQMFTSSPPFILPLTDLFQNANYILPSLCLSFQTHGSPFSTSFLNLFEGAT